MRPHPAVAIRLFLALGAAAPLSVRGQAAPPAKEIAVLGTPYLIGEEQIVMGSRRVVDAGEQGILTVNAARLATAYGSRRETVVAGPGEKLLIVQASLRNPSTVERPLGGASPVGMRMLGAAGKGVFRYVSTFDVVSGDYLSAVLKQGDSAVFEMVLRVPAEFRDFRMGFYIRRPVPMATYDFSNTMIRLASVFSPDGMTLADRATVASGTAFDFDAYRRDGVRFTASSIGSQRRGTVSVNVTNPMPLPVKWGWQYVTPELVLQDGTVLAGVRDLIDQATGRTWSGDLAAGTTMTANFLFTLPVGAVPRPVRLTSIPSKRTIEVTL